MARRTNTAGIQIRMADNGRWFAQREGNKNPSFRTDTQRDAIFRASEIAKREGVPLTIYNRDGQVRRVYKYAQ